MGVSSQTAEVILSSLAVPARSHLHLGAAATLSLGLVALLLALVLERTHAALWQLYKFHGYETAGVITLSKNTGWHFAACTALLCAVLLALRYAARRACAKIPERITSIGLVGLVLAASLYAFIAFGPLNHWRP